MFGLMTVKRHREVVRFATAALEESVASKDETIGRLVRERDDYLIRLHQAKVLVQQERAELATLRAKKPSRGPDGKFVGRK